MSFSPYLNHLTYPINQVNQYLQAPLNLQTINPPIIINHPQINYLQNYLNLPYPNLLTYHLNSIIPLLYLVYLVLILHQTLHLLKLVLLLILIIYLLINHQTSLILDSIYQVIFR